MAKKDKTEILVILDRSLSMGTIKDDMQEGLWEFIKDQSKLPGECNVTIYNFDDKWEKNTTSKPVNKVTKNDCVLIPRGSTALFDAIVKSLSDYESIYNRTQDGIKPEFVCVLVITDGEENASQEFKKIEPVQQIIKRITEKYDWKFTYLAADMGAFN